MKQTKISLKRQAGVNGIRGILNLNNKDMRHLQLCLDDPIVDIDYKDGYLVVIPHNSEMASRRRLEYTEEIKNKVSRMDLSYEQAVKINEILEG